MIVFGWLSGCQSPTPVGREALGLCTLLDCDGGACAQVPIRDDEPCASGVGLCKYDVVRPGDVYCVVPAGLPAGECDVGLWEMHCAGADVDCDDHNPCTTDRCLGSACEHLPLDDKVVCGDGMACFRGACCAQKANAK